MEWTWQERNELTRLKKFIDDAPYLELDYNIDCILGPSQTSLFPCGESNAIEFDTGATKADINSNVEPNMSLSMIE